VPDEFDRRPQPLGEQLGTGEVGGKPNLEIGGESAPIEPTVETLSEELVA
jgi:hypothetical protein